MVALRGSLWVSLLLHRLHHLLWRLLVLGRHHLWLSLHYRLLVLLRVAHYWCLHLHLLIWCVCSHAYICHRHDHLRLIDYDDTAMAIAMMIEISLKLFVALTFAAADNAACCPRMYVKPSHQADQSNHKGDHQEGDGSYDCSYYASDDSNNNVQVRVRKLLIRPGYLRVRNSDGTSSRDLWSYYRNRNLLHLW